MKRIKSKKFQGVYIYFSARRPGDECYYINYRDANRRVVNEKVGWKSEGYTQEQANRVRISRIHAARHTNELPDKTGADRLSFEQAFQAWASYQENRGIKRVDNLIVMYTHHLKDDLGQFALREITTDMINRLTRKMEARGLRPGTIALTHHVIQAVYKHSAKFLGYTGTNPMAFVPRIRYKHIRRERILTKEEAQILLEKMREVGEDYYLFTAMGILTGMRLSEILAAKGRDIDYNTGTLRVIGKGNKLRYVEVPPNLLEVIKRRGVHPNDNIIGHTWNIKRWQRTVDKLGLNKDVTPGDRIHSVSPHTMRHTYGSWLAAAGTPITVIKELMGHADITTTMHYLKNAPRAGAPYAAKIADGVI